MEPRTLHILNKCSTTELHPPGPPFRCFFFSFLFFLVVLGMCACGKCFTTDHTHTPRWPLFYESVAGPQHGKCRRGVSGHRGAAGKHRLPLRCCCRLCTSGAQEGPGLPRSFPAACSLLTSSLGIPACMISKHSQFSICFYSSEGVLICGDSVPRIDPVMEYPFVHLLENVPAHLKCYVKDAFLLLDRL